MYFILFYYYFFLLIFILLVWLTTCPYPLLIHYTVLQGCLVDKGVAHSNLYPMAYNPYQSSAMWV